ncbi:MAG: aldehyde ferredoxin oxidoreductase family protein [Thermoleophilia bacterium]
MTLLGKTAFVDLSAGSIRVEATAEKLVRAFLGGRGLNMAYLYRLLPAGADPLGPENVLIFGTGLLTGYPAPNSGRMNISAKSPESGILGDANMGGFFPAAMKKSGFDRIVVTGRAEEPVYLYLSRGRLEIRPAGRYWGLNATAAQAALAEDLGGGVRSAVIGRAGENLVRFACVMNGRKNAAGRGGMGAVMGSKRLKAVVAAGEQEPEIADREALLALRKELNEYLHTSKVIKILGKLGTPMLYENANRLGIVRTKNSRLNQWSAALDGARVEEHVERMVACAGCTVHCRHVNKYGGEGPEFVTVGLLGANLGIDDLVGVIELNNLCNDLGLDTASAGGIIGWAMELAERGLLTAAQTDGPLAWGDVGRVKALLRDIAERRGFGAVLAESSQAPRLGLLPAEATRYLSAVKNLPQSDPIDVRYIKSFALGTAISSRGADHLRSRPTLDILQLPDHVRAAVFGEATDGELTGYATKEIMVEASETIFAVSDSLGICRFVCRLWNSPKLLGYEHFAALARLAVGLDLSPEELRAVGARVIDLERLLNAREGLTRADDTLPPRYFEEPAPLGAAQGHYIEREEFARLLTRYYRRRGWDEEGRLPANRIAEIESLGAAGA